METVQIFQTSGGGRIFQIPLEEFPGLWGNVYVVFVEDGGMTYHVLIDTGSGFGKSNQNLESGIEAINGLFGYSFGFEDLTHILITHGHIEHFGGLNFVRSHTSAQIGIHELDRRILTNYEERLTVVARKMERFLTEAGISFESRKDLLEMYRFTKSLFHSLPVDFTYEACGLRVGPFELLHVPGHSAGHVVIRLHDILFSGDHILEDISPHQAPEHLTLHTGLDHYLNSLEALRSWADQPRLILGGHKKPFGNLNTRIDEITQLHRSRLGEVLEILNHPHTIAETAQSLFGNLKGYNKLLALEETGAHVEYLYQRGLLEIENLHDLESSTNEIAIRYRCIECQI